MMMRKRDIKLLGADFFEKNKDSPKAKMLQQEIEEESREEEEGPEEKPTKFRKKKLDTSKIDKFSGTKWGNEYLQKLYRIAQGEFREDRSHRVEKAIFSFLTDPEESKLFKFLLHKYTLQQRDISPFKP